MLNVTTGSLKYLFSYYHSRSEAMVESCRPRSRFQIDDVKLNYIPEPFSTQPWATTLAGRRRICYEHKLLLLIKKFRAALLCLFAIEHLWNRNEEEKKEIKRRKKKGSRNIYNDSLPLIIFTFQFWSRAEEAFRVSRKSALGGNLCLQTQKKNDLGSIGVIRRNRTSNVSQSLLFEETIKCSFSISLNNWIIFFISLLLSSFDIASYTSDL